MEKTPHDPLDINLDEWEFLPDNTSFLDFGLEDVKGLLSKEIIYMDYFREEPKLIQHQQFNDQNNPAELTANKNHDHDEAEGFKDISISHVFKFKPNGEELIGIPQTVMPELCEGGSELEEMVSMQVEEKEKSVCEGFSFSICGRRLTGVVGTLCSIGVVAAATICIIVGGRQHKQQHHHQNHIALFRMNAVDKRLTQVVQQGSRLSQGIAAARSSPANISFGGYYDRF